MKFSTKTQTALSIVIANDGAINHLKFARQFWTVQSQEIGSVKRATRRYLTQLCQAGWLQYQSQSDIYTITPEGEKLITAAILDDIEKFRGTENPPIIITNLSDYAAQWHSRSAYATYLDVTQTRKTITEN